MPCMMNGNAAPETGCPSLASGRARGLLLGPTSFKDGPGKNDLLGAAVPCLGDARLGNAVFHQKDDPLSGRIRASKFETTFMIDFANRLPQRGHVRTLKPG